MPHEWPGPGQSLLWTKALRKWLPRDISGKKRDTAQHRITQNDGSEPSLLASWRMYKKGLSNSQFPRQKRGDSLQEYRWWWWGSRTIKRAQESEHPGSAGKTAASRLQGFPWVSTLHPTSLPLTPQTLPLPSYKANSLLFLYYVFQSRNHELGCQRAKSEPSAP